MNSMFRLTLPIASTIAGQVDTLTLILTLLCGFIVLLVSGLVLVFGVRYWHGTRANRKITKRGQHRLEWGWTLATLGAFLAFFVWAAIVYFEMHVAPAGAMEIAAIGKQWMWKFQHPGGRREINELHVPVGRPILLTMTSQDVIHSLFVPAFRIKQDVLPGRYAYTWFQATKPGEYHLFCTQYCGTSHSAMRGKVIAMEPARYEQWLRTGIQDQVGLSETSMASRGRELFTRLGCISCHGAQVGRMAPDLNGIYGTRVTLSTGASVVADDDYIRESILNPRAKIVQGYQAIMPSFQGVVNEEDLLDLIAYIKSLRGTPQGSGPTGPTRGSTISEISRNLGIRSPIQGPAANARPSPRGRPRRHK